MISTDTAKTENPTLLVATSGGHLEQLRNLYNRFHPKPSAVEWVSHPGEQLDALRAEGNIVHEVPYVGPRGYRALSTNIRPALQLLRRQRFARIVSTGAGIAIPYAVAARLFHTPYHYIESQTRLQGPSFTGKILAKIPRINLYAQNRSWSTSKWHYSGSGLDGYAPENVDPPPSVSRVVVTLGTMRRYGFRRAVEQILKVLPEVADADADVLWQTGCTDVTGLGISTHEAVPTHDLQEAIGTADLVFMHAGVGSALVALQHGKVPVVLPRESAFGEHVDDHQQLLAKELSNRGLAVTTSPTYLNKGHITTALSTMIQRRDAPPMFQLQM